jgi:hypothetical protein
MVHSSTARLENAKLEGLAQKRCIVELIKQLRRPHIHYLFTSRITRAPPKISAALFRGACYHFYTAVDTSGPPILPLERNTQ